MLETALFDAIKLKPTVAKHNKSAPNPFSVDIVKILKQEKSEVVQVVSTATDFYLLLYFRDVLLKTKTKDTVDGFDPINGELCYLSDDIGNITFNSKLTTTFDSRLSWIDEFMFTYLCAACAGELRHAANKANMSDGDRKLLSSFGVLGPSGSSDLTRSLTQHRFLNTVTSATVANFLSLGTRIFLLSGWGGSFGGKKWADISKTGQKRLDGSLDRIQFIDRVYDLKHNGGPIFDKNKSVSNSNLQNFLNSKLSASKDSDWSPWFKYCTTDVLELLKHAKSAGMWKGNVPVNVKGLASSLSSKKTDDDDDDNDNDDDAAMESSDDSADEEPEYKPMTKTKAVEYAFSSEVEKCQNHMK